MTAQLYWYIGSVITSALAVGLALGIQWRLLHRVLLDLLGSSIRARLMGTLLAAALVSLTIAGSLLPPSSIDLTASTPEAYFRNGSKQILSGFLALLLGLTFVGGVLIKLILNHEASRNHHPDINPPS